MSESGYLIAPDGDEGRGVLVLGSWWGLGDGVREVCDRLADHGYVALAPDLVGEGRTTEDPDTARSWLADRDMNVVADLVQSSATLLRSTAATPDAPLGVVGLQMGASWALWLASRSPEVVGAVSFFYGHQDVDRLDLDSAVQAHFAEFDELVPEDDKVLLSAALHLECAIVECFDYPGTSSGFAETGPTYDAAAATLAWNRTLAFLDRTLDR
ncbi:MAG TPA: dienelactone hydrolase family protein [Acidimicrobiales bacterium]|nr:dienelactone hydrolase family protein [Acidimicrobiales bacterium]